MPPHPVHRLQPTSKAHLIPAEILSEIFLIIAQDWNWSEHRRKLMLMCRRWHAIMLSTPGIPSPLWIRRSTNIEVVQAAIQGRRWLLDVIVGTDDEGIQEDLNTDDFHTSFTIATQAASRWRSLELLSFPPPGEYRVLHSVQPLEKLESFTFSGGCNLGNFFEPLMTAVKTTATLRLTTMQLYNDNAILYLVQPACFHIFCSLSDLRLWLSVKMENPANILPYLHRLELLYARHLHLPFYPPDAPLPLVQTLRCLLLKSVSVQWMAGKVFPALQECTIIFPHHVDTITFEPVTMPSCISLAYHSNGLGPLQNFHHPPLTTLTVRCGQWNARRGNPQLVAVSPIVAASAQSLTKLELEVKCSEQLLVYALSLIPALNRLALRLASPHALSEAFFQTFIVADSTANSASKMAGPPSQTTTPICVKLTLLDLYYKRWLRHTERKALILVFGDIVSSRLTARDFGLWLNFHGREQAWRVEGPRNPIYWPSGARTSVVGILGPHGIIPCSSHYNFTDIPFIEAEYLVVSGHDQLPIDCLSNLHHLVDLRVGHVPEVLSTAPLHNLPPFHTLRVLEAYSIHQSFLAGQTFHNLERCRILPDQDGDNFSPGVPTEMPVCTRLDVGDITLLATLKLPQICDLGVFFDNQESNLIWDKHIAMNANLSGLKLLHVHYWGPGVDLVQILQSLPVLTKLIVGNGEDLDVAFFRVFIPENRASGLTQASGEGHIPAMLCPMLKSLLIEEADPKEKPGVLVLREVVTLRALCESPLEEFTFSQFQLEPGRAFKLIQGDGSFGMEIVALPEGAKAFELFI